MRVLTFALLLVSYFSSTSVAVVLRRGAKPSIPQPASIKARQASRDAVVHRMTHPRVDQPQTSPILEPVLTCGSQPVDTPFVALTDFSSPFLGQDFLGRTIIGGEGSEDIEALFVDRDIMQITNFALDSRCRLYLVGAVPRRYAFVGFSGSFAVVELRSREESGEFLTCTTTPLPIGDKLTCSGLEYSNFYYNPELDARLLLFSPTTPSELLDQFTQVNIYIP